jgi:hypothetical protein
LVTLPMEGHVRGKEIVFCYNFCVVTDYFGWNSISQISLGQNRNNKFPSPDLAANYEDSLRSRDINVRLRIRKFWNSEIILERNARRILRNLQLCHVILSRTYVTHFYLFSIPETEVKALRLNLWTTRPTNRMNVTWNPRSVMGNQLI